MAMAWFVRNADGGERRNTTQNELKPCPFCGGEIDERGGQCNYGKRIMTLDLKCDKCGTIFKFKSNWIVNPYSEAIEAWNRRANDGKVD